LHIVSAQLPLKLVLMKAFSASSEAQACRSRKRAALRGPFDFLPDDDRSNQRFL
jgi:hypothetical protein